MRTHRALHDLQPDERVLLRIHRHPLLLLRRALPLLLIAAALLAVVVTLGELGITLYRAALGLLLLLFPPPLLWMWWDWRSDVLVLTDRRLINIERTPLLRERRWEATLGSIQNVAVISSGFLSHLMKYASLVIDTSSRGTETLPGIWGARMAADTIITVQDRESSRSNRLRRLRTGMGLALPSDETTQVNFGVISCRKHPWLLVKAFARPALLLLVTFLLFALTHAYLLLVLGGAAAALWGAWLVDDWRNDELTITPERIVQVSRSPLGFRDESWQAPLDKVRDISYSITSPLAHLFDYGSILVQTEGESHDFTLAGVPHPREISAQLNRRMQARDRKKDRALMREVETRVLALLEEHGL